jgi:hypothetical protein
MFRPGVLAITVALFGSTQALNVGAPALVRAAPYSSPIVSRASPVNMVAMTGDTLGASLKMRCDTSGAGYAIYWCNVDGQLVVAGDYVTDSRKAMLAAKGFELSFAEESEPFSLPALGEGPVATCYQTGTPQFVKDVSQSSMKRKALAAKYGIKQVAWVPMEGGVMEFGTSEGPCTADWDSMPMCPTMPKAEIRKGFENLGASYCLFWQNRNMEYSVVAEYTSQSRKEALKADRGDDKTFATESKEFSLDAKGDGPVATAARTGKEIIISDVSSMKRAKIAKEFGIAKVHMVPVEGGVLEYGTPASDYLSGDLMKASLKMRCDTSGAGYAIYWKESFGKLTIAGSYLTESRKKALAAMGRKQSFAEASYGIKLMADGDGPVASVFRSQEPVYFQDVASSNMKCKELALECGIKSVCFVPVAGGVMEYGVSDGPGTADWTSIEDARTAIMPKAEMKRAFENGATHLIFWKKNGNDYESGASYLIPERVRALKAVRGDDKSYTSESIKMSFPADGFGPIATTARSGKEMIVKEASKSNMKRAPLAEEFDIGDIHFVPCRDGVLEYGRGRVS